jgi:hypothetical protein
MDDGVKVTEMVQLAPAATEGPQVLVCEKSPLPAMLPIFSVALPVFVRVTGCGLLAVPIGCPLKIRFTGENVTAGAVPVPLKLTVCGLPTALSVTLREALRDPMTVGLNVTLMLQLAPAARFLPQALVSAKSALLAPVILMLVILSDEFPVFVKVTV